MDVEATTTAVRQAEVGAADQDDARPHGRTVRSRSRRAWSCRCEVTARPSMIGCAGGRARDRAACGKLMDKSERTDGTFSRQRDFAFDPQGNLYVCPAGKELKKYHPLIPQATRRSDQRRHEDLLRAQAGLPRLHAQVPVLPENVSARKIARSVHEAARDKGPCDRQHRGLRRLTSRTKEGRDALRSSEAHPQARSIAPPRSKRSQRRIPLSRHRPKSAKTGEAYPPPCADPRHIRRRGRRICTSLTPLKSKARARHNRGFFRQHRNEAELFHIGR